MLSSIPADTGFKENFSSLQKEVEEALPFFLPSADTPPRELHQAMHYSVMAGGKRLRPIIVLATCRALEAQLDPLPMACAVEFLHTYSLIHDDLPCMDNSDLRRGEPTCHRKFGEATALLAGDALLTLALGLPAQSYKKHPGLAADLVAELAQAAGSRHLIGGQMADLLAEGKEISPSELAFIHANKTGALLQSCLVLGGVLAETSVSTLSRLRSLGQHLGLAFQIIDDILDATMTSDQLGKTAGADAVAGKNTYVKVHGLQRAREAAKAETMLAEEYARSISGDNSFLVGLVRYMGARLN